MVDEVKVEEVKQEEEKPKTSATEEIFNKKISFIVEDKNVQVWRMSVETLEIATATILKIIVIFQPGRPVYNMIQQEDIAIMRRVIASCSSIKEDQILKLAPSSFFKLMDKWLEVNEGELIEASKLFFVVRERIASVGSKITKITVK